ncbi:hypothetical protein, partial [Sporosarcina sp. NPDC096371]|uniref:hypothetical protein n=1 Tax=Sporosarcina sp. NPDC096371 TaxID=3364530 RepID=UPI0038268686
MRKLTLLLSLILIFSIFTNQNQTFAQKGDKEVTEAQLNEFLKQAGTPDDLLKRWEYDQKLDIYNKSKDSVLKFDTTEETDFVKDPLTSQLIESTDDSILEISPLATIPASKLTVSHDVFTRIFNNTAYKVVYANYSWNNTKSGGTKGDKIAIAVPDGWAITSSTFNCQEYQSGYPANGYTYKANCGGSTYDLDFYGAVWSLTRTDNVWHKGWANLEM